ncbi:MAG: acyl carrier protein [Burkholderiales bacterium]
MASLTSESVANQLAEIAGKAVGKAGADINRDLSLRDQGIDSLMLAELIFEVEDTFDVQIANEREMLAKMETVNELTAYIVAQKAAQ